MREKYFELDLLTQQFIVHRWHTPLGREIRDNIINGLKENKEIKEILEKYILKHPANVESYEYPYYPPDAIIAKDFWVIANDDLRGIHFYGEDFSGTTGFSKTNMGYGLFTNCNFSNVNFDYAGFSHTIFENCDLTNCIFDNTLCNSSKFSNCNLSHSVFLRTNFIETDFSSSDLRSCYFEYTKLSQIIVNYLTKFDKKLRRSWKERKLPSERLPDLYRGIRLAYEKAELSSYADHYLLQEAKTNRKYVLWPKLTDKFSFSSLYTWIKDYIWFVISGYGTKPVNTVLLGGSISLFYSFVYFFSGTPVEASLTKTNFLTALYFSFTTFATLGYGDISYSVNRPWMRLLSTTEAWAGAVLIALFVVVIARKILRR